MLSRFLKALVAFLGLAGIGGLAFAVARRVAFPWPLEWMEGGTLEHAVRLLNGLPLYGPPTAEFVPYLYPPLAYIPMAASVALFGESLPAARIPSVIATALTLFFVARAAARAGGGPLGGLLAAGLYAVGFGYGGAFFDVARVDAVFLALVAAGTERLQAERPRTALALFALSVFAKQHGLLFLLAASAWLAWKDLRRHLPGLVGVWGATLFLGVALHLDSEGWFTRYCFGLPRAHGVLWRLIPAYLLVDVAFTLPVLACAAAFGLARHLRAPRPVDVLLCAALAASAFGRAHVGGFHNVLLPGLALLAVVGSAELVPAILAHRRLALRFGLAVVLSVQFFLLFQSPATYWPAVDAEARWTELARSLRRCAAGGRSVALDHAGLTGTPFLHTMALSDLRQAGDTPLARAGTRALVRALGSPTAPRALGVGARFPALDEAVAGHYRLCTVVRAPPFPSGYTPPDVTLYRLASVPSEGARP